MSDVVDIDPSLRALDALADDFADPGDETAGCVSMWPLLAVPSDALSPLDRDARDRHLARCARCRVAMTDAWLDAEGEALAPVRAAIPAATALPTLPERRRRGVKILAIASAVAAAASLLVVGFPMMLGSGASHTVAPLHDASPGAPDRRPLDLIFVVEDGARTPDVRAAVNAALARVKDHVSSDARITIATAHDHALEVVARDRAPADALAIAPLAGPAVAPAYNEVLGDADALFRDPTHRRAIVIVGAACGDWPAEQAVDAVRANGVAVVAAALQPSPCASFVRGAFVARNSFDIVATLGAAVDSAARAASGPPDIEHRAPIDLLVLIDGGPIFMGNVTAPDEPSSYDDVRTMLDELDPHIPEHSVIRIATVNGDVVTLLGHGDYPYIPLARAVIGDQAAYNGNDAPRWSVALERARHLLDARHDRTRALMVLGEHCMGDSRDDRDDTARQLAALRADGVKVAIVETEPASELDVCNGELAGASGYHRVAPHPSSIPGLVFDAVEDFSKPDPNAAPTPPADLLHFIHDTLSAP